MGADLITLDEFKQAEGLDSLQNDTRLQGLISQVSQLVKTYCANSFVDFYDTDKVEEFSIDQDTYRIQVSESPLVSVTSVQERTAYNEAYSTLDVNNYDYYINIDDDSIIRTSSSGYAYWAKGPGSVKITYKAGYADTPIDLKLAVADLVNYYYNDEYKPRRTLGTASMANDPSSTQWRNVGFPDHIKRVLDLYKNINV